MPVIASPSARDLARSWRAVLGRLELDMNVHVFDTWLRGTEPVRLEADSLVVEARHGASCEWLNGRLACMVDRAIAGVFSEPLHVRFVPHTPPAAAPRGPLDRLDDARDDAGEVTAHGRLIGAANSEFTFDCYIAGAGNSVAVEACLSLLGPGARDASPVVLYGAPGLGKTHLLHALANRALERGWQVACLRAEEFTNRFQAALRANRVPEFQSELRSLQLLIVDDLEYFPGHPATIDEFNHTIDAITNAGGLVACAGERSPSELQLPPRLISRLTGGILARIEVLAQADRRAYINARIREQRLALPAWATDRIVTCEMPSIRLLRCAVNSVLMLERAGQLNPERLDACLVQFGGMHDRSSRTLDQRALVERVAVHFEVSFEEITGRSRRRPVTEARAVAVAALSERGQSYAQIASLFGTRDRSTVLGVAERGRRILAGDALLRARLAG